MPAQELLKVMCCLATECAGAQCRPWHQQSLAGIWEGVCLCIPPFGPLFLLLPVTLNKEDLRKGKSSYIE